MASKKRPRVARRERQRKLKKLGDAREKLARLSPGGAPERPLVAASASVVEMTAQRLGCARCDGELKIESHDAVVGLRRVRCQCRSCGANREVWVQLQSRFVS